jgi:hypothetical protein
MRNHFRSTHGQGKSIKPVENAEKNKNGAVSVERQLTLQSEEPRPNLHAFQARRNEPRHINKVAAKLNSFAIYEKTLICVSVPVLFGTDS